MIIIITLVLHGGASRGGGQRGHVPPHWAAAKKLVRVSPIHLSSTLFHSFQLIFCCTIYLSAAALPRTHLGLLRIQTSSWSFRCPRQLQPLFAPPYHVLHVFILVHACIMHLNVFVHTDLHTCSILLLYSVRT